MNQILIFSLLLNAVIGINGYLGIELNFSAPAINRELYEDVLDPELCAEQLQYVKNNTLLLLRFLDSGLRIPNGILTGNTIHYGNYFQCLSIKEDTDNVPVEGKYCSITVPLNQSLHLPEWIAQIPNRIEQLSEFDMRNLKISRDTLEELEKLTKFQNNRAVDGVLHRTRNTFMPAGFTLAICIPKPCTTEEAIEGFFFNLTAFGFKYTDNYCRLNNDKPWSPADYVSISILSFLGLVTFISTSYDLWQRFVTVSDPKSINTLYSSFSLYTNCRRLTSFTKNPGALECIDGIRAISMMWVILGHSFSTLPAAFNILDGLLWLTSNSSIWLTSALFAVDTFFTLSGLLLVYTTAGKLSGVKLLKNLHLFYLNRIFRMFPILAMGILLQASLFHYISDGPDWGQVTRMTEDCRNHWWFTLIYLHNFFNNTTMCLPHTWYLAIDMQLHIISPIVLFWVLSGNKKYGWTAISAALVCFFTAATTYIFFMEFPGSVIFPGREDQYEYSQKYFYINTLTRAAPFFVGMAFGYLLHSWRGKKIKLSKIAVLLYWIFTLGLLISVIFANLPMKNENYSNQIYDNIYNAFAMALWATGLGMLIFACTHGFGRPINWFLSLQMWKLPSRLSYGMFVYHFSIMAVTSGSAVQPVFFSVIGTVFRFLSLFALSFSASFVLTLFVDSPFSTLIKLLLGGGVKKDINNNTKSVQHEG